MVAISRLVFYEIEILIEMKQASKVAIFRCFQSILH